MGILQKAELAAVKKREEEEKAVAAVARARQRADVAAKKRKQQKQEKKGERALACPKPIHSEELGGKEALKSLDCLGKGPMPDIRCTGDSQKFVKLMEDGKKVAAVILKTAADFRGEDEYLVGMLKGAEGILSKKADEPDDENSWLIPLMRDTAQRVSTFGSGISQQARGFGQYAKSRLQPVIQPWQQHVQNLMQPRQQTPTWQPPGWYTPPEGSTDPIGDYHAGLKDRWAGARNFDMRDYSLVAAGRGGDAAAQQELQHIQQENRERMAGAAQARQNPQYYVDLAKQNPAKTDYFMGKAREVATQQGVDVPTTAGEFASKRAPATGVSAVPRGQFGDRPHSYSPGGRFYEFGAPDRYKKYTEGQA